MDSILSSFEKKDTLNPEIWENVGSNDFSEIKLKKEIRKNLLEIAKDFTDSFDLEMDIEDVLFVGSLANYTWSDYSDIDLHIVFDDKKLNSDFDVVNQLFDAKKIAYNAKHNITIKNYDVEVFAQNTEHKMTSNGVYSVLYNTWVNKPTNENNTFDKEVIMKKIKDFNKKLEKIENLEDSKNKISELKKLKDKLNRYRQSGLSERGELSNENLVFKYLRRSGFIEKLKNIRTELEDDMLSLENFEF